MKENTVNTYNILEGGLFHWTPWTKNTLNMENNNR